MVRELFLCPYTWQYWRRLPRVIKVFWKNSNRITENEHYVRNPQDLKYLFIIHNVIANIVYFEIPVGNVDRAKLFFHSLLGWNTDEIPHR